VWIRDNLDIHALKQLEGFDKLEQGAKDLAVRIEHDQSELKKALEAHALSSSVRDITTKDLIKFEHEWTRKTILESIERPWSGKFRRNAGALGDASAYEEKPDDQEKLRVVEDMLLESLQFATMTDRFDDVHPAHEKTYEWIFKTPDIDPEWSKWTDFPKWLAGGEGTYWINGKAASGKSTIMRYICDNPQTTMLLKEWAHPKTMIVATHFFWSSGTPDQRSYTGLLRALTFEILQQRRDLIPVVFPRQWNERQKYPMEAIKNSMSISWTLSKLRRAFKRIFEKCGDDTRFCLFIDGLDEYDGEPSDIIDLFTKIPSNSKVCLSSRPLHDFAIAFKSSPGLRLQDLTFGDIKQYVDDELEANTQMKELQLQYPEEASQLVLEIVNKADGVFLWVKLVVLSLIRGLRNSDQISDLQRRLRLLPPSLEDLFTQIIGKLEPVYIQQSSRIFQIFAKASAKANTYATPSPENFSSLELFFAENQDWNMLTLPPTRYLEDRDLISRCEIVDTWLRTRCGGLIEAHRDPKLYRRYNSRLAYLHRTVHDFVNLPEIKSRILGPTVGTGFNTSQALLQSSVLYLKWVVQPMDHKTTNETLLRWSQTLSLFTEKGLSSAFDAEFEIGKAQVFMLDELDRVCKGLVRDVSPSCDWSSDNMNDDPKIHCNSILSLAIGSGLYLYVTEKLQSEPSLIYNKAGRPLLHYAVQADTGQIKAPRVSEEIIELLLAFGASPNLTYEGVSAWEYVLAAIFRTLGKPDIDISELLVWTRISRLFLLHGANMLQCLGNDLNKSAYEIITAAFYDRFPEETRDLQRMMIPPGEIREKRLHLQISSNSASSPPSQEARTEIIPRLPPYKLKRLKFRIAAPEAQCSMQNVSKRMEFIKKFITAEKSPSGLHSNPLSTRNETPAANQQPSSWHGKRTPGLQTQSPNSAERSRTRTQQLSLSQIYNLISLDGESA